MDAEQKPELEQAVETPIKKPEEQDRELDQINEIRWEYDLPEITRDDITEQHRRYMDEKYGYDIDS